jgi:hypothetical protein
MTSVGESGGGVIMVMLDEWKRGILRQAYVLRRAVDMAFG